MALIECPECTQQVSQSALACPHCATKLRELKRGFFGKIFKWGFIVFNILMAVWLFTYWGDVGSMSSTAANEYEEAGMAIGATLGTGMILGFWVFGSIILGLIVLLTKPKA